MPQAAHVPPHGTQLYASLLCLTVCPSFVRIGGFVLSHASMMLVVMALAKHVSAGAVPVVVIFGNAFVMCIEGLLVGIQTLRLEFYEIFSRFYSGDGVPFTPVKINYDETIE